MIFVSSGHVGMSGGMYSINAYMRISEFRFHLWFVSNTLHTFLISYVGSARVHQLVYNRNTYLGSCLEVSQSQGCRHVNPAQGPVGLYNILGRFTWNAQFLGGHFGQLLSMPTILLLHGHFGIESVQDPYILIIILWFHTELSTGWLAWHTTVCHVKYDCRTIQQWYWVNSLSRSGWLLILSVWSVPGLPW